ncbi:SICA antigen [Plasmodium coatneyi]|uniref:SICA antigen n=1 Tax=Plasmodium coatneyi TaxID=208452 RepID=A0A1B1DYP3_9APIC|nr:SICA antigen [Plasmodium coatneyi]ANQ07739.1 SICA antigen [Plasmodium coatneyi]
MKKLSQNKGGTLSWENIQGDIKQVLGKLSKALTDNEETNKNLCNNTAGQQGRTPTDSEKTACNNIAKGLKGIYNIKPEPNGNQANPVQNTNFEQTIGCLLLNVYAQEIKSKCPIMGKTVKEAFTINEGLHTTECNSGGKNKCEQCQWDECANYTIKEGVDLRTKVKDMLLGNKDIKQTLSTISDSCKQSTTIRGWFALFSRDVTEKDKEQNILLQGMLDSCDLKNDDGGVGLDKYKDFCNIMMRNIFLVTEVGNEYKNKEGQEQDQPACEKIVKGIPVCDLLKVWMYYMRIFCIPEAVIKNVLSVVQQVREELNGKLIRVKNYVDCTYDAAFRIPDGDISYLVGEAHDLFSTSELHTKMSGITNKNEWCKNTPTRPKFSREGPGAQDRITNANKEDLNKLKSLVENVTEVLKEEEGGGGSKPGEAPEPISPTKVPEVPKKVIPEEKKEASENTDQDTKSDEQEPEEENEEEEEEREEELEPKDEAAAAPSGDVPQEPPGEAADKLGAGSASLSPRTPSPAPLASKMDSPVLPYLPLAPAVLGISIMSYLLWKYFGMLRKTRKRYRRAPHIRGPSLEQQIVDHVDQPSPREYYIVKKRKPRSTPKKRRKKRGLGRRRAGVRRRMIIDIHFEVLDECQKGELHLKKEDFFVILVQEFMGCEFIKEKKVPSSDSGFREEDFVTKEDVPKEQVPSTDLGFRIIVPKEQVPSSNSGFRKEVFVPDEGVPKEQVPSLDSEFREEDFITNESVS